MHTSRELVSLVCLSPSCLQAYWCLQETPFNSDEHSSCQQLQSNLRAIFSGGISWNLLWPLRIMIYFIRAPFQKFLDGWSGLFHHHEVSNCRHGSPRSSNLRHDITFGSMAHDLLISCFKAVCNKAPNTFDSTTCRTAHRCFLRFYQSAFTLRLVLVGQAA